MIISARVEIDEHTYEVTIECDQSVAPCLATVVAHDALMALLPHRVENPVR